MGNPRPMQSQFHNTAHRNLLCLGDLSFLRLLFQQVKGFLPANAVGLKPRFPLELFDGLHRILSADAISLACEISTGNQEKLHPTHIITAHPFLHKHPARHGNSTKTQPEHEDSQNKCCLSSHKQSPPILFR